MYSDDYQIDAARTLIDVPPRFYTNQEIMIIWNVLGIAGEVGEVLSAPPEKLEEEIGDLMWYVAALYTKIGERLQPFDDTSSLKRPDLIIAASAIAEATKKQIFHNHGMDMSRLKELLDDLWSAILLYCDFCGIDPRAAKRFNIEKLKQRYPDGWDEQRSKHLEDE